MDVSLRQWPIFVTGLLLGATGAMALGLHRATQAELAAAKAPTTSLAAAPALPAASAVSAATAAAATVAQAEPDARRMQDADAQMRAAAEAFRAQEAAAAAATPFAIALAHAPKPRVRKVVREAIAEPVAEPVAVDPPIAIAPNPAPERGDSVARLRTATSLMGAAPARRSEPAEAVVDKVEAARGSAFAPDGGEGRPQPQ